MSPASEQLERLISRYLDGECTAGERRELQAALRNDPAAEALPLGAGRGTGPGPRAWINGPDLLDLSDPHRSAGPGQIPLSRYGRAFS